MIPTDIDRRITKWTQQKGYRLFIYQIILLLLVLMHSLGYFDPFFEITAHFIILTAIILSVFLLQMQSIQIYFVAFVFWIITCFFQLMSIEVWAERTSMYAFESLCIATVSLLCASVSIHHSGKKQYKKRKSK